VFSTSAKAQVAPEELPAKLDETMALGRASWPLTAIRQLADVFLKCANGRKKSPAFEARWLNLSGFCLRPGFGFPGDDFRVEQARRVYAVGLQYTNQVQCEIDWWIFWGRIAGGLNRNQQADIYQRIAPFLLPRGNKKPPRINSSLLREMWRTAASLELLPIQTRTELGDALVRGVKAGTARESELWCVSRIGARELFYAPINQVLPPATVTRWVEALLPLPAAAETLASLGRRTDDPTRDLSSATRDAVRQKLAAQPRSAQLLTIFDGEEERDERALGRIFGEELPSGLVLSSAAEPAL
jgi:DNA-K related protein